jgi:hypothetical protein
MARLRSILLVGAALAALNGVALAQDNSQAPGDSTAATPGPGTIVPSSLQGSETWTCSMSGPQGQSTFCTTALMRSGGPYATTPFTGGTGQTTYTPPLQTRYVILTSALTAALTVNFPANPVDGQLLTVVNGSGGNFTFNVNMQKASGIGLVGSASLANLPGGSSGEFIYSATNKTWYKVR